MSCISHIRNYAVEFDCFKILDAFTFENFIIKRVKGDENCERNLAVAAQVYAWLGK